MNPPRHGAVLCITTTSLLLLLLGQQGGAASSNFKAHSKYVASTDPSAVVPGKFLVQLHQSADGDGVNASYIDPFAKAEQAVAFSAASSSTGSIIAHVEYVYTAIFSGFALANADDDLLVEHLLNDPEVKSVEEASYGEYHQDVPGWHLDRVDQVCPILDNQFETEWTGEGVEVWVIDSGVLLSHNDFLDEQGNRRIRCGYSPDNACDDVVGHGTHVAGIVGGLTSGVAPRADLVMAKIELQDYRPEIQYIVAALDLMVQDKQSQPSKKLVANLSLGYSVFQHAQSGCGNCCRKWYCCSCLRWQ